MGVSVQKDSVERLMTRLTAAKNAVNNAIVDAFASVGDDVTTQIRDGRLSNWNDDTGSLRSSIGYVVARRGEIVRMSGFETVLQGADGSRKGKEKAAQLASEYSMFDYILIIIAGEEYAVYVESVENKVVLSSGWLYIKKELVNVMNAKIQAALSNL